MTGVRNKVLERLFRPADGGFTPELSRHVLAVQFTGEEQAQYEFLSEAAQRGQLTADESEELDELLAVNDVLVLLHSKARVSLKTTPVA